VDTLDKMMVRLLDLFCLAAAPVTPLFGMEGDTIRGALATQCLGPDRIHRACPWATLAASNHPVQTATVVHAPRSSVPNSVSQDQNPRCIPGASSTIANQAEGSPRSSATVVRAKGRDLNDPRTRRPLRHRIPADAFLRGPLTAGPYRS